MNISFFDKDGNVVTFGDYSLKKDGNARLLEISFNDGTKDYSVVVDRFDLMIAARAFTDLFNG